MRILAVETSWDKGGICLLDEAHPVEEYHLQESHSHGRDLAPAVMDLLKKHAWSVHELDVICVDVGPGSYTGLRVGVSFVKTLAYAEEISVATVSSCDAIASRAPLRTNNLCVMIDAQWNELYVAFYRAEDGSWTRSSEIHTASPGEVAENVDDRTMILGNGIPVFREHTGSNRAVFGPEAYWQPQAGVVGQIGFESFQNGEEVDLYSLQPMYLRPTQADVDRN